VPKRVREVLAPRAPRPPRSRAHPGVGVPTLDDLLTAAPATGATAARAAEDVAAAAVGAAEDVRRSTEELGVSSRFGRPGREFNRNHPFYLGFVGAFGVLVAYGLWQVLGQLSAVITLLVVSLFLALGLEPLVEWLEKRGLPRPAAIGAVFAGVILLVGAFISAVVPIIVAQATELAAQIPRSIVDIQRTQWFMDLDARFDVAGRLTSELEQGLANGEMVTALFGGVFGAGAAVVSGFFSTFTVLVLTLYFLASLRSTKAAAYRLVPRSRRRRVQLLGDEISRRIGGYVIGQIAIALLNAVASYVVMLVVGVPYALVLAVTVGIFGLIPLVGATIGAVIVVIVALFSSVPDAVVMAVYYVAYQQVENYVIAPRIMQRAVAVPGAVAIVAALAGGSLLGILGALIAIPLAAGVLLVVQEVVMPRQERS
jgi:predicted PurR-regulated permease PerM